MTQINLKDTELQKKSSKELVLEICKLTKEIKELMIEVEKLKNKQ